MTKSTQRIIAFIMALVAGSVMAGAIHTWSTGEKLTSADLNANFQHIHNLMVGGHGARLVDADVSGSAAISTSKLAGYRLVTKAWASIALCTTATCTITSSQNITSVTRSATGVYLITLAYTATNTAYMINLTGMFQSTRHLCFADPGLTTTTINVACYNVDGTTAADSAFAFAVYDND